MTIKSIKARQIFDSRGNPTVEVDLVTDLGLFRAAVPSGASTGIHEALELRDEDKANYHGKSVLKAVDHINKSLGPEVIKSGICVTEQAKVSLARSLKWPFFINFSLFTLSSSMSWWSS